MNLTFHIVDHIINVRKRLLGWKKRINIVNSIKIRLIKRIITWKNLEIKEIDVIFSAF
jgi:hypothetical protein